jgi:hypothetical protein
MATPAGVDVTYQLGVEASRGVLPVSGANRKLTALSIVPTSRFETEQYRQAGFKNTTGVVPQKAYGEGSYDGKLCFNHILYVIASLWGLTGGSPAGAGAAKTWRSEPQTSGPDSNAKTYVVERIINNAATRALYVKLISLALASSQGAINISGSCVSQFPTEGETPSAGSIDEVQALSKTGTVSGGTFTLSYAGQTTATIPYNASAATIREKLIDLTNIGADDIETSGGPINTTPVVISFKGALAGTNVAAITVDNTSLTGGGSLAIATTTAGASTGITTIPNRLVSRQMIDVFLDDTYGSIGSTKVVRPYEESLNVGNKDDAFWAHNTDFASFVDLVEIPHDLTFGFKMAHDDQSEDFYNSISLNATKYLRWQATGPDEIESGIFERIRLDMALKFINAQPILGDPVYGYEYTCALLHDGDLGGALEWEVINRLTSL